MQRSFALFRHHVLSPGKWKHTPPHTLNLHSPLLCLQSNRDCTAGLTLCSHILTAWVRIQQVDKSYAQHGGKPAAVEWPVKYSLKGQNPILAV